MSKPCRIDTKLIRRFNEIRMPQEIFELPQEDLDAFFNDRGWLILVRRDKQLFLRVIRRKNPQ